MTTLEDFTHTLAAPVLLDGGVHDTPTAGARIATLFAARSSADVLAVLSWFAQRGLRAEWASYEAHAGGAWKPDPRDRDSARKATFAIAHRDRMKGRGLHALDAMRASVLAEWSVTAELLSRSEALVAIEPIVTLALHGHSSWADYVEQLLLGLEFAEGTSDDSLRARLSARMEGWPSKLEEGAAANSSSASHGASGDASVLVLALRLAVDCPTCKRPVLIDGFTQEPHCRGCGAAFSLEPAEWARFFGQDIAALRAGNDDENPYGTDYGARFLSRRMTARATAPTCPCGAVVHADGPGTAACACGRTTRVRLADACALAVDTNARLVVEPQSRPIDAAATFACAACGTQQLLGAEPSRIRTCITCAIHTYVDDAAHARSFDPPRWRTFFLVTTG